VEADFDGTLALERLAAIGKLDEYADAIDSDDFQAVTRLLGLAGFSSETIARVVAQMLANDP
jgi:hypothetical protein